MEDKSLHRDENQIKSALGDILFTPIHFPLIRELSDCDFIFLSSQVEAQEKQRFVVWFQRRWRFLSDLSLVI